MTLLSPNEHQEAAIAHRQGPLRIMAGAGTGKTSTLALRIESLVRSGVRPERVLALTFMDKAASELRGRIDRQVKGATQSSERVDVSTYHAFGARIVAEFGYLLELPPEPLLLNSAEQWILVWRGINDVEFNFLELGHLQAKGPMQGEIMNILNLNSRLKDELRTLDDLDEFITSMPLNDDDMMMKLRDYYRVLQVYEKRKAEAGAIDYGDQIAMAAHLLDVPEVAETLQARYSHILVDEFQDTNYGQAEMVRKLAGHGRANICVVGDPNQAIYLFRGAAPDNMQRFEEEEFADVVTIALAENYRSTQVILDAANAVWKDEPGEFRGNLVAASFETGSQPKFVTAPHLEAEKDWVANEIQRLLDAGEANVGEIIILAKSNAVKLEFQKALTAHGIPAVALGGDSLLAMREVQQVISWLIAIANRDDNAAFLDIMMVDRWGLDEREIHGFGADVLGSEPLSARVERLVASGAATPAVSEFLAELNRLTLLSYQVSLTRLVQEIIGTRGGAYTTQERRNLHQFARLVEQFSSARVDRPVLTDLVEYLDLLQRAGGEERDDDISEDYPEGAVQIMTSHKAKGSQRKAVFVVAAHSYRGGKLEDELPAQLAHHVEGQPEWRPEEAGTSFKEYFDGYNRRVDQWRREQGEAEMRRVFYVALTRAEKLLYVTRSEKPRGKANAYLSDYAKQVAEACEQTQASVVDPPSSPHLLGGVIEQALIDAPVELVGANVPAALRASLLPVWLSNGGTEADFVEAICLFEVICAGLSIELEIIEALERRLSERTSEAALALLGNFSFSALDAFQACPHRFYLQYIVRLPGRPPQFTKYGSQFHELLQREANARRAGVPLSFDELSELLPSGSGSGGRRPEELLKCYREAPDGSAEPLLVEQRFTLRIGDRWINGAIDRVHRLPDGTIEVVDYKTNREAWSTERVRDGLQLPIYLLAVREIFPELTPPPQKAAMFFLSTGDRIEVTYSSDELEQFRGRLTRLIESAATVGANSHTASATTCEWCDYRDFCQFAVVTNS